MYGYDNFLRKATHYQLMTTVLVSVCALGYSSALAIGALCGGLVMGANFWSMRVLSRNLFGDGPLNAKMRSLVLLSLKLVAVLAVLALLIMHFRIDVGGIALGMSTLFVGLALSMMINPVGAQNAEHLEK